MGNKNQIEKIVEDTLNSLDGIQRATANPYLFGRIKARLEKEEKNFWSRSFSFISRPAVAIAAIIIAIFINVTIVFELGSQQTQTNQDGEQLFAGEYDLSSSGIYDATIDQQ